MFAEATEWERGYPFSVRAFEAIGTRADAFAARVLDTHARILDGRDDTDGAIHAAERALRIKRRSRTDEGVETLVADMTVGFKAIRETFTSRVTLDRPRMKILAEYVDGPFSRLDNRWTFREDGTGCSVEFWIDYEFRSRTLGLLMGAMFDHAFRRFSEAFEERANKVYG